jgi:hypothetical protein
VCASGSTWDKETIFPFRENSAAFLLRHIASILIIRSFLFIEQEV